MRTHFVNSNGAKFCDIGMDTNITAPPPSSHAHTQKKNQDVEKSYLLI